jgi:bifunctional DNA-binding transcriptional regulator/antitoxin component of YhaV-PrlF toxin-antitoxin module
MKKEKITSEVYHIKKGKKIVAIEGIITIPKSLAKKLKLKPDYTIEKVR